jgi:hypothetical protein
MHPHAYCGLARKNHAQAEATSSLRARKLLNRPLRICLRACFKTNEHKQTVLNSSLQKAAEFSGVAGEFRCHSLHRSQIFKDL